MAKLFTEGAMTLQQILNLVAGGLAVLAYYPYIKAILRRETKPSKATWIIWSSLSALTAAGMVQAGTLNAQIAVVVIGDVVIVILAFKFGTSGWKPIEKFCLAGAVIGLALWAVTINPLVAIVIGLAVTTIGAVPTIVKTWHHPEQEDPLAYSLMAASCVSQIAGVSAWTVEAAAQPIVFLFTAGVILALILTRPRPKPWRDTFDHL